VRSADRYHDAQVLDLRVVDHVVNAIHGGMRHVLRFEPFHPVVQWMTHETRIQLQAQRFVLGDTLLAGVKARVAGQLGRLERRDQRLPELFQRGQMDCDQTLVLGAQDVCLRQPRTVR
jgi:hypothetical protein